MTQAWGRDARDGPREYNFDRQGYDGTLAGTEISGTILPSWQNYSAKLMIPPANSYAVLAKLKTLRTPLSYPTISLLYVTRPARSNAYDNIESAIGKKGGWRDKSMLVTLLFFSLYVTLCTVVLINSMSLGMT